VYKCLACLLNSLYVYFNPATGVPPGGGASGSSKGSGGSSKGSSSGSSGSSIAPRLIPVDVFTYVSEAVDSDSAGVSAFT
jgi:hypothetical protein